MAPIIDRIDLDKVDVAQMSKVTGIKTTDILRGLSEEDHTNFLKHLNAAKTREEVWTVYCATPEGSSMKVTAAYRYSAVLETELDSVTTLSQITEIYHHTLEGSAARAKAIRKLAALFPRRI